MGCSACFLFPDLSDPWLTNVLGYPGCSVTRLPGVSPGHTAEPLCFLLQSGHLARDKRDTVLGEGQRRVSCENLRARTWATPRWSVSGDPCHSPLVFSDATDRCGSPSCVMQLHPRGCAASRLATPAGVPPAAAWRPARWPDAEGQDRGGRRWHLQRLPQRGGRWETCPGTPH